jgi:hypothetical protein
MRSQNRISRINYLNSIIRILFIIFIFLSINGCKKNTENNITPNIYNFHGIVTFDKGGNRMGNWGTDDRDWSTDIYWTEEELALLDFVDTISLDNTFIKDTTDWNTGPGIHVMPQNNVIAFPNPVNKSLVIMYKGLGLIKFKATIVDKYFNRLFTYACKDSTATIMLSVSDSTIFKNGTIYRMYYSLSTIDSINFYKGHGDILICRESELQDCQEFVP